MEWSSHRISVGATLRRRIRAIAEAECRTPAAQLRFLAQLALDAPRPPDLDDARGLEQNPSRATNPAARSMIVRAPAEFWARVDARAKRMGETRSEAVRTLAEAGMAIRAEGGGHG